MSEWAFRKIRNGYLLTVYSGKDSDYHSEDTFFADIETFIVWARENA